MAVHSVAKDGKLNTTLVPNCTEQPAEVSPGAAQSVAIW